MHFPETRYSVVQALNSGDEAQRVRAQALLATIYRGPILSYLTRRLRGDSGRAEELTQSFFVAAIERDIFATYLSDKAKFRTFVRVCLDRFVDTAHRDASRQKRGGGVAALSLDVEGEHGPLELVDDEDAESLFAREFKRSLVARSLELLQERLRASDRVRTFEVFSRFDLYDGAGDRPSYATIAEELGSSVSQVTNQLHAARKELRRVVATTLRELCASEAEFLDEAKLLGVDPSPP